LKFNFSRSKAYNEEKVNDWLSKIPNPSLSNTEEKDNIMEILSLFKFRYGKYLSDISSLL
jgi:hypothetical protein